MTTSIDPADHAHLSERADRKDSQVRRLRVVASVLAILTIALGAALVATVLSDDDGGVASAPEEVIGVVESFERAFEEQDEELVLSIITDDFLSNTDVYNPNTLKPAFTARMTPASLSSEVRAQAFDIERSGELLVAGEGPWIVAAHETWTDKFNRDEGVRVYVIIDDNGTPKLAGYYYVGTLYDVLPDFGD